MKKLLIFGCLFCGISFISAQVQFGVKSGLNISTLENEDIDYGYEIMGIYIGGFLNVPLVENFSFQPELLISMQGARSDDQPYYVIDENGDFVIEGYSVTVKHNLIYANLPMMFKYNLIKNLAIEAGPQVGISLQNKFYMERYYDGHGAGFYSGTTKEDANVDFGFSVGAEYIIYKGLGVGARYNRSLLNTEEMENSVISFGLSYQFNKFESN